MKRILIILIVGLIFSHFNKLFSQQSADILYEDRSLTIKPIPIDIEAYDKWIKDNSKYYGGHPNTGAYRNLRVVINFVVDTLGNVVNPLICYGVGGPVNYDGEARRLIKDNPNKWIPGSMNGKLVETEVNYMIDFANNNNSIMTKNFTRIKIKKKKKE